MNILQKAIDANAEVEIKLRSLKQALMHDLLTGRVRVPVSKEAP